MKAFAFVLLCALAAVQGRYTGLQSTRSAAALGENPWLVHLRIAVSTSGLLNTGAGVLIDNSWVLTSAANVADSRFIWTRYGVVNVINPSLVTENSVVRLHPNYDPATGANNIALISLNRYVHATDNISPIVAIGNAASDSGRLCVFGEVNSAPGEQLNCYEVDVAQAEDGSLSVSSDEVAASAFDSGAPLVSNDALVGLLVGAGSEDSVGDFLAVADYVEWIEQETGLDLSPEAVPVAPEAVSFVQ